MYALNLKKPLSYHVSVSFFKIILRTLTLRGLPKCYFQSTIKFLCTYNNLTTRKSYITFSNRSLIPECVDEDEKVVFGKSKTSMLILACSSPFFETCNKFIESNR